MKKKGLYLGILTFISILIISLFNYPIQAHTPNINVTIDGEEMKPVEVPLVLSARFKIKPEKRDEFLKLATATLEPTRKEEGNISYSFYEESTVPNSFIYFEEWRSRKDLAFHLQQPYTKNLLDKFSDLADGEGNIRVYDIKSLTYGLDNVE